MKVNEAEMAETILNRIGAPTEARWGFGYSENRGAPQFLAGWDVPTVHEAKTEGKRIAKRIGRSQHGQATSEVSWCDITDESTNETRRVPSVSACGIIDSLDVLVIAMINVETN